MTSNKEPGSGDCRRQAERAEQGRDAAIEVRAAWRPSARQRWYWIWRLCSQEVRGMTLGRAAAMERLNAEAAPSHRETWQGCPSASQQRLQRQTFPFFPLKIILFLIRWHCCLHLDVHMAEEFSGFSQPTLQPGHASDSSRAHSSPMRVCISLLSNA